jgi:hypothetical protein
VIRDSSSVPTIMGELAFCFVLPAPRSHSQYSFKNSQQTRIFNTLNKYTKTMFGLLDDDEEVAVEVAPVDNKKDESGSDLQVSTSLPEGGDSSSSAAWTDVASTKSRRLAPQWAAATKPESPAAAAANTATDSSKKKGTSSCNERETFNHCSPPCHILP